jgi:hypothetical protein
MVIAAAQTTADVFDAMYDRVEASGGVAGGAPGGVAGGAVHFTMTWLAASVAAWVTLL